MRPFRIPLPGHLAVVAVACLLAACVYRLDTQQGNLLDAEQVGAVEVGMTRSQVRFLLGTPMVIDSFDQQRWDYVYYFRPGKRGNTLRAHVIVWFDGDTVRRIEQPEPLPKEARKSSG
jgi:outer membrane protein assembly factor BamE